MNYCRAHMLDLTVDMCLYVGYNKLLSTSDGLHVNCAYDNILESVFETKKKDSILESTS